MKEKDRLQLSGSTVREKYMINKSMEEDQLVIVCTNNNESCKIHTYALVDSGATSLSFVDERFARHHNLPLHKITIH